MTELAEQGDLVGLAPGEDGKGVLTCECGYVEPVVDDGNYRFIPTGWWRWHVDPETSTVSQVDQYRYICAACFEKLPEE